MNMEKVKKLSKLFKESLREGIKYAQGKPAKVKVETLYIKTTSGRFPDGRRFLFGTNTLKT